MEDKRRQELFATTNQGNKNKDHILYLDHDHELRHHNRLTKASDGNIETLLLLFQSKFK